jgi:FkbM family methyltransferase
VKTAARSCGVEIRRHRPVGARRARFLDLLAIDTVLDVGANRGQYALELRRYGYRGRIVSFEPVQDAFVALARAAAHDAAWECHRLALGAAAGGAEMHVASNVASSSLLPMLDAHKRAAPQVETMGTEDVEVRPLDSCEISASMRTLLKLDVQGYEDRVLAGASRTLENVVAVECELSVQPLYEGERTFLDMLALFDRLGFALVGLAPGLTDAAGRVVQFEAWFVRHGLSATLEDAP